MPFIDVCLLCVLCCCVCWLCVVICVCVIVVCVGGRVARVGGRGKSGGEGRGEEVEGRVEREGEWSGGGGKGRSLDGRGEWSGGGGKGQGEGERSGVVRRDWRTGSERAGSGEEESRGKVGEGWVMRGRVWERGGREEGGVGRAGSGGGRWWRAGLAVMVGSHNRRSLQLFPKYNASPTLRSETALPSKNPTTYVKTTTPYNR